MRAYRLMNCRSGAARHRLYLVFSAAAVSLLTIRPFVALLEKQNFYQSIGTVAIQPFLLMCYLFIFAFAYSFLARYAPKHETFRKDGSMLAPREVVIGRDGIHHFSQNYQSLTRWSGIIKIEDDQEFIMLYTDALAAYLIPKRCFSSSGESSAFAAEARKLWNEEKSQMSENFRSGMPLKPVDNAPPVEPPGLNA